MIIATDNLNKIFRTETVQTSALKDIQFSVAEGEFVALMGPSGCGKSTLMNILGMVDTPSSGSYKFLGQEVVGASERERSRVRKANIGFIFQSFNLIDELTVLENVELPLVYNKVPVKERRQRAEQVIEKLNMQHRMHHYPLQLSGGQQQRVAVARAIVMAPKLILADEPTGNLDSTHGDEVIQILQQLNNDGSTIVMVTHSEYDAGFAHRVVRLRDGQIMSAEELAQEAAEKQAAAQSVSAEGSATVE